uniref:40S ribosomal protein S11, putative n=1 Tax=Arundo donax TaxID=35708 RepID=A0A0A9HKR1_ARUDO
MLQLNEMVIGTHNHMGFRFTIQVLEVIQVEFLIHMVNVKKARRRQNLMIKLLGPGCLGSSERLLPRSTL